MKTRLLTVLAMFFISVSAQAASGGHGEIPWLTITKQTISFVCVVGILIYLLRKPAVDFFETRATSFEKMLVLAKKAKEEADHQKRQVTLKLQALEGSANESIMKARQEAEQMVSKIKSEAESAAQSLREEARLAAQREIEKAKQEIKLEALNSAMGQTRETMRTSVAEPDQRRLQNEFVEKIQVVR